MKQHWTHIELVKYWTLSQDEIRVIQTKNNKLVYAFKMRYFDIHGLMFNASYPTPSVVINFIKEQLSNNKLKKSVSNNLLNIIENIEKSIDVIDETIISNGIIEN